MSKINNAFDLACEIYAEHGVDVSAAMRKLDNIHLSIHAWQGDDVTGFESVQHALTGGCQVTGNYPGRARNSNELRSDLDVAMSLIPGSHRVCLQAHQIDMAIPGVDRDRFCAGQFAGWMDWAEKKKIKLDIAPVFYSHPKLDHGMSLSHPDASIRRFWIEHGKAVRKIAVEMGRRQQDACVCNFWMPDGSKDIVIDRKGPRERLRDSLDEIFHEQYPAEYIRDAVEPKLFGIGTEFYTAGSNEFYQWYCATRGKMLCMDTGHFHPTESIADKLSAIFCFSDEMLLHVSRGVRWDSDHVISLNDDLLSLAQEMTRYGYLDKIHIGLDYFDGSINRVAAWVIGARNMQKALLAALLEPVMELRELENAFDYSSRLAAEEEARILPFGIVWEEFCARHEMPGGTKFMNTIMEYEKRELNKRK